MVGLKSPRLNSMGLFLYLKILEWIQALSNQ